VTTYALAADPWIALGDPTRRAIFARLARRPQSVTDLASELPVSRPAVSQHLKVLKGAGLVRVRPDGARRIYAVDTDGLQSLRSELEGFWSAALSNFMELVESDEPTTEETT
jgi:DNA-binding transcriptional ArsR family regulator